MLGALLYSAGAMAPYFIRDFLGLYKGIVDVEIE